VIVARYPETEAPADEEVLQHLLDNEATHRVEAEYQIADESFATLYRLIPMGEHEFPFVLVFNDFAFTGTHQVFGTFRAAEGAFLTVVDVLRENHLKDCDKGRDKCRHAPPYTPPPPPKIVRRSTKSSA